MSAPRTEPTSGAPPRRLGDFEILGELGRGGMGVVYEARQLSLNRLVALKVLSDSLGLTPRAVERFRREAEAAARLHHTNIVPVHATGEEGGSHYYAMERVDGPSLDKVIRWLREAPTGDTAAAEPTPSTIAPPGESAGPADPMATIPCPSGPRREGTPPPPGSLPAPATGAAYFDAVARLIAEVADALDYAHQQGVIHRDIKPSNLLVSPQGRLSLNDFGLARLLEQPGMTMTGECVGTPLYMSPEQVAAGRAPLDHRTDIYSLGATLYELLTLRPPFPGGSRDQVMAQVIHQEPVSPRRLDRRVPVDLETICLKCLEKDPGRRYQTAGQMAEDLRRYVNRFAISARRVGPVGRAMKLVRRHPGLTAAVACAVLAILGAAFLAYRGAVAERDRRAEREQHEEELRRNALDKALLAAMSGDLDGAGKAIDEAEGLGASPGQLRLLRGQVASHRGDTPAAIRHLEQAVQLLPDSVAARAMLALACYHSPQVTRTEQLFRELEKMSPSTPEDHLFKGQVEAIIRPERSLQTLDKAIDLRDSVIARAVRTQVRANRALFLGKVSDAELALEDAQVARGMLPGNPFVLAQSVHAHLVAASFYEDPGRARDRRRVLDLGRRDVEALKRFSSSPIAMQACFWYFEYVGDEEAAYQMSRRGTEFRLVPLLYLRREYSQALEAAERAVSRGSGLARVERGFILAELEGGRPAQARAAYREARAHPEELGFGQVCPPMILLLLGQKEEAIQASLQIRRNPSQVLSWYGGWYFTYLDYSCGLITADDLLKAAGASRPQQCEAHFLIGLRRLAEGDRPGAREHFRKSSDTRVFIYWDWMWARAFLKRLERDPAWPRWIPPKK